MGLTEAAMPRFSLWIIPSVWMLCLLIAVAVIIWNHKPADGTEIGTANLCVDVTSIFS